MTLAFIGRAGGSHAGDPPLAWRMPLLGDALIGVAAVGLVIAMLRRPTFRLWTIVIAWNAIGIWDAGAAFVVHSTNPWPSFFMVQTFGSSMFVMAAAMHATCIAVAVSAPVRTLFGVSQRIADTEHSLR